MLDVAVDVQPASVTNHNHRMPAVSSKRRTVVSSAETCERGPVGPSVCRHTCQSS
jgi:hypothetical protein